MEGHARDCTHPIGLPYKQDKSARARLLDATAKRKKVCLSREPLYNRRNPHVCAMYDAVVWMLKVRGGCAYGSAACNLLASNSRSCSCAFSPSAGTLQMLADGHAALDEGLRREARELLEVLQWCLVHPHAHGHHTLSWLSHDCAFVEAVFPVLCKNYGKMPRFLAPIISAERLHEAYGVSPEAIGGHAFLSPEQLVFDL